MFEFQESDQEYEEVIKEITTMECAHTRNYLVMKVKTTGRLERLIPGIGKYMQQFREMRETLSFQMDQHWFLYMHMCEDLFAQWVAYDGEHATDESPSSHKLS
jgi:hypothetical protein